MVDAATLGIVVGRSGRAFSVTETVAYYQIPRAST
jgi:hypothetical protein